MRRTRTFLGGMDEEVMVVWDETKLERTGERSREGSSRKGFVWKQFPFDVSLAGYKIKGSNFIGFRDL